MPATDSNATARTAAALLAASALPTAEARALLAAVLGVRRERLVARPEQAVDAAAAARFADLAARRRAGEPIAYLLGRREFYGREFEVGPAVLVPRPETELLVDLALDALRAHPAPRVLDLGTGSGCIAITLALEQPRAQVFGVDRSPAALAVARTNAAALGARVSLLASDWFGAVQGRFDVVVANPPYIAAGDPHLPALAHEPPHALVAGRDGLDSLRIIVREAPAHLLPGGRLLVEHGHDQGAAVRTLFIEAGFDNVHTVRDAAGVERVVSGRKRRKPA
jgi:release factor glutamine methyltransferase